MRYIVE